MTPQELVQSYNYEIIDCKKLIRLYQSRHDEKYVQKYKDRLITIKMLYWNIFFLHMDSKDLAQILTTRKPTKRERRKYRYIEDGFQWPLIYILQWRGFEFPVYNDDCGQSEFVRLPDGTCRSSFCYDMFAEETLACEVDEYINEQLHR